MKIYGEFELPEEFIKSLVTKEVLEELFKKYLKDDVIVLPPPKPDPKPEPEPEPEPVLPDCKAGPEIKSVRILSDQSLLVNFWGEEVYEIQYELYLNDKLIESNKFTPQNDKPVLNLKEKLQTGNYKLKFKATLCKGEHTVEFDYKKNEESRPNKELELTFYYGK